MKKLLLLLTMMLCLTGCGTTTEEGKVITKEDFVVDGYEIDKFEISANDVKLTMKTDKDIKEYIDLISETLWNLESATIEVFNLKAESTEFSEKTLNDFICTIEYDRKNGMNNQAMKKISYIKLPDIKESETLPKFENKTVQNNDREVIIELTMEEVDLYQIISYSKTYINLVKDLNKDIKTVKLIINDKYEYDGNDLIKVVENI